MNNSAKNTKIDEDEARQTQRRYSATSSVNSVVRVVRYIQNESHWDKKLLKFFITLTFKKEHFVQDNKYKGLSRVIELFKDNGASFILIRREETKDHGTHFHIATNVYLTINKLRTAWKHGYIYVTPIMDSNKIINYMFKNLSCDTNVLKVIIKKSWLYFIPKEFKY